jgi:hypothetical protein
LDLSTPGLSLLVIGAAFVVLFAVPVWLAARLVGAGNATLLRASLSLLLGTVLAALSAMFGGIAAVLLAPISFLVAFKVLLEASLFQSIVLAILSAMGSALMMKMLGSAVVAVFGGQSA